jgi:hypothetical protein
MATDGTEHLWRQALLILAEQPQNARHPADAAADLRKQFGGRTRTERMQVLGAALQPEAGDRIEMDHGNQPFSRRGDCACCCGELIPSPVNHDSRGGFPDAVMI